MLGVFLARSAPAWWRPARADDPAVKAAADALENGVVNQLHAWRPGEAARAPGPWQSEPWTVAMQASDANAWVAASLPKWLANLERPVRLPSQLGELQVGFSSGLVRVGASVEYGGRRHLLSASLRPEIRADGSLWLEATWARIGRMPVPASMVLDQVIAAGDSTLKTDGARAIARVLAGMEPAARAPEIRLADGRRVRLLKIEVRDGQMWLTCRTDASP